MLFVGSRIRAGLVIAIVFLTVLYLVAKIPLKIVGKSIKPILPIILFTAVLNLFFMTGNIRAAGVLVDIENIQRGRVLRRHYGCAHHLPDRGHERC